MADGRLSRLAAVVTIAGAAFTGGYLHSVAGWAGVAGAVGIVLTTASVYLLVRAEAVVDDDRP